MRLKLITCDIFEREVKAAAARSSNQIDIEFLPTNPHRLSESERVSYLQGFIDNVERSRYHAVLLAAGSCKQGLTGLTARWVPLVLPRARDCISLLLQRPRPGRPAPAMPSTTAFAAEGEGRSRAKCVQPAPGLTHWVAPVKTPELGPARGLFTPKKTWLWRERFANETGPGSSGWRAGRTCSVLEMLVNGYWNYTDFLVVAPHWRVVVDGDQGTIAAEELTS